MFKLGFLVPGLLANLVLTQITTVGEASPSFKLITFEDILFNKVALVDVNILSPTQTAAGTTLSGTLTQIRVNVAGWYLALRNLAITVAFATLIYIGVRMAIDSSGEKKARYKELLKHWLVGFALIFILHYIISFVLRINTALVSSLSSGLSTEDYSEILLVKAFDPSLVNSWGAAIMYSILLVITFIFLIVYIKRMLMTCFLVMVAPLITITYSIDKIGNNKSEILNQWMKEFCYNVFIQPFHCIVYLVFVGTATSELLQNANDLNFGAMIRAIVYLLMIFTGEKIIRNIFGFTKSKSVSSKIFSGMMLTKAIDDIRQINNARGSKDDDEGEETVAPLYMPSGVETSTAMLKVNQSGNLGGIAAGSATSENDGTSNSGNTRASGRNAPANGKGAKTTSASSGKIKRTVEKIQNKTPIIVQDAGKRYIKGVKSATGVTTVQNYRARRQTRKSQEMAQQPMSTFRQQFLAASEDYAKQNGLTKQQLEWKIEAIRKTSFDKLENNSDRIYKMWIDKMDKDLLKNGASERYAKGRRNATNAMNDFMDAKYNS